MSFSAAMGNASTWTGDVTEQKTAQTIQMSKTVVSKHYSGRKSGKCLTLYLSYHAFASCIFPECSESTKKAEKGKILRLQLIIHIQKSFSSTAGMHVTGIQVFDKWGMHPFRICLRWGGRLH